MMKDPVTIPTLVEFARLLHEFREYVMRSERERRPMSHHDDIWPRVAEALDAVGLNDTVKPTAYPDLHTRLKTAASQRAHLIRIEVAAWGIEVKRRHEPVIIAVIPWRDLDRVDLVRRIDGAIGVHGLGMGFNAMDVPVPSTMDEDDDIDPAEAAALSLATGELTREDIMRGQRFAIALLRGWPSYRKGDIGDPNYTQWYCTTCHNKLVHRGEICKCTGAGRCRICGCTDDDCSGCIERTGVACSWVEADLCSACVRVAYPPDTVLDTSTVTLDGEAVEVTVRLKDEIPPHVMTLLDHLPVAGIRADEGDGCVYKSPTCKICPDKGKSPLEPTAPALPVPVRVWPS